MKKLISLFFIVAGITIMIYGCGVNSKYYWKYQIWEFLKVNRVEMTTGVAFTLFIVPAGAVLCYLLYRWERRIQIRVWNGGISPFTGDRWVYIGSQGIWEIYRDGHNNRIRICLDVNKFEGEE